jgi:hypothetical protein
MDVHSEGILVYLDNQYVQIRDVQFYDPLNGFIETKEGDMYAPLEQKGKS